MDPYFAEFLGTLVLILMGDGVCACTSLEKSKGKGAGWVVITLAWGFAVMCGVFIAGPYSGAHLNPAVTIGLAVAGSFPWASVLGYIIAQMLGGFCGATLVWAFYKDHYDATDDPDTKLGTFCTMPAIYNPARNFFCEFVGTWLLVFCILMFSVSGNTSEVGLARAARSLSQCSLWRSVCPLEVRQATRSIRQGILPRVSPMPFFLSRALSVTAAGTTAGFLSSARSPEPRSPLCVLS